MNGLVLKQSTTTQNIPFYLVLAADHVTPATGLVPVVTLSKNGSSFASASGAVTEQGSGWYRIDGNATDSNTLGPLVLRAAVATADDVHDMHQVVAYDMTDSVRLGLTALPNAAAAAAGGLWILGSNNTAAITIGALTTGAVSFGAITGTTIQTSGTVTLNALTVSNNFQVGGTVVVTGTTTLNGAVSLASTLGVASTVTLNALTITNNLLVSGNSTVTGTTTHTGAVLFGSTFGIVSTTSLAGVNISAPLACAAISCTTFNSSGTTTLNALVVSTTTTLTGAVQLSSTLGITGAVTLSSTLATGAVTLSALTVTNNLLVSGNSTVTGTTTHTGAVSFGSTFGITGAFTSASASNNIVGIDVKKFLGTTIPTPTVAGVLNVNVSTWNDLVTVSLPLVPTTAGRTLDVSTGGEAGLDWANMGGKTTSNNLSGTRIALVDVVTTVTNNPNAGNGAYTVTATVTDGTNPLQQATVRVTSGLNTFSSVSNSSGQVTFSLDTGSYTVSATCNGYTFTPSTRTVTGNNAGTLYSTPIAMTAVVIPVAPTDPSLCLIYGYIRDTRTGAVKPNVRVTATLKPGAVCYAGGFLVGREKSCVTDSNGLFQLSVIKNTSITPTTTEWTIICADAGIKYEAAFTASTFDLNTVLP